MLEKLAFNKHFSILQKFINYGYKKFYSTDPWANAIKYHSNTLQSGLLGFKRTSKIYRAYPVACTIKVYDRKFMIKNYASVCSVAYDRNLRS
jgi:hypothetical protein